MATYLTSNTGTATNANKFTYSVWLKRTQLCDTNGQRFYQGYQDGNNRFYAMFDNTNSNPDQLWIYNVIGGATKLYWVSTRKFRDLNAWYHIVFSADSTQGTEADRFKVYINGVEETGWTKTNNQPQNVNWGNQLAQTNGDLTISGTESQSQPFFGLMSHINFIDGTAYPATAFGSTDTTTGEWKINTSPNVTYGNNGYFILKDGNTITDSSPNSNNFTLASGTLTKTEDCPSNVFATWNVLDSHYFWGATESSWCTLGNTKARSGNSQYSSCSATLGASSGKYYWEIKLSAASNSEKYFHIGIKSKQDLNTSTGLGDLSTDYSYRGHSGETENNGSSTSYGATYQVGDIVGVAMDLDNNKLYFHKNGTYQNSGVPTSGSTGTGAISITDPASTDFGFYVPAWSWQDGSSYGTIEANFGNGYFGTTAVSSAGTNASGNGIFEYDVPTGYTALSTKGLNS